MRQQDFTSKETQILCKGRSIFKNFSPVVAGMLPFKVSKVDTFCSFIFKKDLYIPNRSPSIYKKLFKKGFRGKFYRKKPTDENSPK